MRFTSVTTRVRGGKKLSFKMTKERRRKKSEKRHMYLYRRQNMKDVSVESKT